MINLMYKNERVIIPIDELIESYFMTHVDSQYTLTDITLLDQDDVQVLQKREGHKVMIDLVTED